MRVVGLAGWALSTVARAPWMRAGKTPYPLQIVRHLAAHLKPGGALHVNFIHAPGGENLVESARQPAEAIASMDTNLRGVIPVSVNGPNQIYARHDNPR